jgi:cytochrome c-type biogenesis protein CcmE
MKRKHKRLTFVLIGLGLLSAAAGLALFAFEDNIVFFYSPTDVLAKDLSPDQRVRLGGLVEEDSVVRAEGSTIVRFRITDLQNAVPVAFGGLLPNLFREGQGVVTEGVWANGVFEASEVLAKHDENYMPPEVAEALKKSGQWQGNEGQGNEGQGGEEEIKTQ